MLGAIFHFLNAEFVCTLASINITLVSGARMIFWTGSGSRNINFVLPQNCQASASTKNVQWD